MHRPRVREINLSAVIIAIYGHTNAAGPAQVRLQQLLEAAHALRTIEFGGPLEPKPPREALARPVDIHERFCLQAPCLDEIIEPQCAIDDQYRILDDDVAMLLEDFFVQADLEAGAAVIQNQSDPIWPPADFQ